MEENNLEPAKKKFKLDNEDILNMANCSVSLNISSRETIPSLVCRLNVPNFLTLPEYSGTVFKSPTFTFADATWFFEFQSSDASQIKNKKDIRRFHVNIVRLNSVKQQEIFNIVTLLDANDKEFECRFATTVFEEDENDASIADFFNDEASIARHNDDPFFDRLETLNLIIQLFCEKSAVSDEDEIQNTTNAETEVTKDENCNVTLELSTRKSISSVACTLKIPNFFILPEYDGTKFESRTLAFANASWCFRFSSYMAWNSEDHKEDNSEDYTDIEFCACMVRLDSELPKQWICSKTILLDKNDKVYKRIIDCCLFNEDNNEDNIYAFDNEESCFDRRESLTVIFSLFYDKSTEKEVHHLQNTTQKDAEKLSQDFKKLFLSGKNKDFTLRVAETEFLVHRDVLIARSPVFEAMLSHDIARKNDGLINVPDCEPLAMEQFLYYVYTGKVNALNQENVLGVYYIADKHSMTLLRKQCSEFIKKSLSPLFICRVIRLALNHRDNELLECAAEYFVNHNNDILNTKEWILFLKSNAIDANEFLSKAFKKQNDSK